MRSWKKRRVCLRRSDEIAKFDQYHGSWVYKLSATDGEKFALTRADIVE